MTRYRAIVVDPPWAYPEGWPVGGEGGQAVRAARRRGEDAQLRRRTPMKYSVLDIPSIAALPIPSLADSSGCHVYLWTTNRYLRTAFDVLDAWGVRFSQAVVWAKTPMGLGPGGAFAQSTEYILVGRIGSLRWRERVDSTWFNWPRMGKAHSRKPDAFLDLVEKISPEPRLEMFARRQRLGWDTWGNEALDHVGHFQDTGAAECAS